MVSTKEIKHLAKLAHLHLSEKAIKKYQKELSKILDYVSQLQKAKIKDVSLMENFGFLRKDETWLELIAQGEKLLAQAPLKEKDFIKTKGIFAQSKKTIKRSRKIQ